MKRTSSGTKRSSGSKVTLKSEDAPEASLQRIEAAATTDLVVARLTLGLMEAIMGWERPILFPGYRARLRDWRQFPERLHDDVRSLIDWATSPTDVRLDSFYTSSLRIEHAVRELRTKSVLGARFRRSASRLARRFPELSETKWAPSGVTYSLFSEHIGQPLTENIVSKASAFRPQHLQILPHDAYLNSSCTPGTLTIRLNEDGYTIREVSLALETPKQAVPRGGRQIEGDLIDFFETGTEGVIWMVENERRQGQEALEIICQGDHLTISDQLGVVLWKGIVRCDKKTGWRRYPLNPQYGQQCALGRWVHWIQKGFKPDAWAKFFIRPDYDRLRGTLVRKAAGKSGDARPGPE